MKRQAQRNFSHAAQDYDAHSSLQKMTAEQLSSFVSAHIHPPKTILDVGTGTGQLSSALRRRFPDARITLNDYSQDMLSMAQHKFSNDANVGFFLGDAEDVTFPDGPFDLIATNMVVHWFSSPMKGFANLLRQGKVVALAAPIHGTFSEWKEAHAAFFPSSRLRDFPTAGELLDVAFSFGAKVIFAECKNYLFHLPNVRAFHEHVKSVGAHTPFCTYTIAEVRRLVDRFLQGMNVNYEIFFAIFHQEHASCRSLSPALTLA